MTLNVHRLKSGLVIIELFIFEFLYEVLITLPIVCYFIKKLVYS